MTITRISQMSGLVHSLEIDVSLEQIRLWESGRLIQDVMPNLTPNEREFIMTGITAEEWDEENDDDEQREDQCEDSFLDGYYESLTECDFGE